MIKILRLIWHPGCVGFALVGILLFYNTCVWIEKPDQGAKSPASRLQTILGLPESEGRGRLARYLALETNLNAEQIKEALKNAAKEKIEIAGAAMQETISSGLTAVSILLPLSVGIIGFSVAKQSIKGMNQLAWACFFFSLSLTFALFNLFRLPTMLRVINVANDLPTLKLLIVQLYFLFVGLLYLLVGGIKIYRSRSRASGGE